MNFAQAKQIPIAEYLAGRGLRPISVRGSQCWYHSPLHEEHTPSFKVDTERNIWYDHGQGRGGTIVDLVQFLDNVSSTDALQRLASTEHLPLPVSFQTSGKLSEGQQPTSEVKIKSVKTLSNLALVRYLESRRIPFEIGRAYLSECYYSVGDKSFFALGFKNDQGGYELRNSLWQGASSPKAITTRLAGDRGTIAVFEGFFDMLSALTYFKKTEPAHTTLVLNSVALLETALPTLKKYKRVHLFLDNDTAGRRASEVIKAACNSVIDYSAIYYPHHKDFNDLLTIDTHE